MYLQGGTGIISNSLFIGNSASASEDDGSAVGGAVSLQSGGSVSSSVFTNNTASSGVQSASAWFEIVLWVTFIFCDQVPAAPYMFRMAWGHSPTVTLLAILRQRHPAPEVHLEVRLLFRRAAPSAAPSSPITQPLPSHRVRAGRARISCLTDFPCI